MAKRARAAGTLAALTDGGLPLERLMLETDAPFMAPDKYVVRVQCDASLLPKSTVYIYIELCLGMILNAGTGFRPAVALVGARMSPQHCLQCVVRWRQHSESVL